MPNTLFKALAVFDVKTPQGFRCKAREGKSQLDQQFLKYLDPSGTTTISHSESLKTFFIPCSDARFQIQQNVPTMPKCIDLLIRCLY